MPSSESVDDQEVGGECPVAHYCPTGTVHPMKCNAGTYNPITGQPTCVICPQGFYCLANSTTYTNTPCNSGYYCPNGTKYREEFACPAGSFNNKTMAISIDDCIPCPPGMYCEGNGLSVPSGECTEGFYCYSGSDTPTPVQTQTNMTMDTINSINRTNCSCTGNNEEVGGRCWPGTYCPAATGCPLLCSPGMFCDDYELSMPTGPCIEGYYCSGGAHSATPEEGVCPLGHYCLEGSSLPTGCPSGTFSSTIGNPNVSYCVLCTEGQFCAGIGLSMPVGKCLGGYYCPRGQEVADPSNFTCPRGAFCINGSSLPERCPQGFYQPEIGKSSCLSCPSRYFCDPEMLIVFDRTSGIMLGVVDPILCPAGYYCPEETMFSTQFPCPSGTYSNATGMHSREQCLNCPEEMYCDDEGLIEPTGRCSPGYYCVSRANASQPTDGLTGNICPKGRYCPQGVSTGIPCPRGTYNNHTGISNVSECMLCVPGYYCATEGLMEPSRLCVSGYYCSLGAVVATPTDLVTEGGELCPPGHFCPSGSAVPTPCNASSYQPDIGAQNESSCLPCEPGSYCNSSGLAESSGLCAAGYYCLLGASVSEPVDGITGNICPLGAQCPVGSSTFTSCADGTYANQTGVSSCYQCPSGRYCVFMDHTEACPIGFYCPEGTGYNYTGCPVGTYGDQEGLADVSECRQCDGGYYCSGTGKKNTSGLCMEGYYCQYGVNISRPSVSSSHTGVGGACLVGHYCPTGSSLPIACPAGSYANATTQPSCFVCPEGFYCPSGSVTGIPCPIGHYCPEGTASQNENQCPQGTYNNFTGATAEHDCLQCLPGHYCASPGLAEPSGLCEAGYYCSQGSVTPRPTDIDVNFTDFSLICPAAVNATGGICPSGFYCPEGASYPVSCTGGMYCPGVMLIEPFAECREGHFCNSSSSTPDQYICFSGHYCPNGSAYSIPCPSGTFLPAEGNAQVDDCIPCTAGMYCAGIGLITPTGNCSEGYYCPGNITSPTPLDFPCSAGHFCPEGSTTPQLCPPGMYQPSSGSGECLDCPSGHYCDPSEGVQALITPPFCSQGFYCPNGTGSVHPACPSGTFGSRAGLEVIEDCSICTAGMYCEGEALTIPTGLCFAGYFCTGGASSPTPHDNITLLESTSEQIWSGNGECPIGYYCLEGSRIPTPCPIGSFSQSRAVTNASGCEPCPRGRYCSFTGPVMVTEAPPCSAGYICTGASSSPTPDAMSSHGYPCPIGHFCLEGALFEDACPLGEYNPFLAQASCLTCPEGTRCPYNNMTIPLNCLPGHYCPSGTSNAIPCPEGTFTQSDNLTSTDECSYCLPGSYCGTAGLIEATGPCAAGYYCERGATSPNPSPSVMFPSNGPCAAGNYCPSGTATPIPCPIGTFLDSTGGFNVSSCRPCVGGSFCNTSGLTSPNGFCSPGFYCPGGSTVYQPLEYICPAGMFCPEGSVLPMACPEGEYQQNTMQAQCEPCPEGRTCVNSTADPALCPPYHYCPRGTGLNPPECPPGTFTYDNTTGLVLPSSCLPCETGRYCRNGVISGNCSAGYFCVSGNSGPSPNVSLLITDSVNSTDYNVTVNLTGACDPESPHPVIGGLCPANHYCLDGTLEPTPCPEHTFSDNEGGSKLSDCSSCPEGMYCPEGGVPLLCPVGHYCPTSSMPIPCPKGSYRNETGGNNSADCYICPQGYWCNETGIIDFTYYICPLGFFCPEGVIVPQICPAGTMGNATGAGVTEDCEPCTPGYYCPPRFCLPEVTELTNNMDSNCTFNMTILPVDGNSTFNDSLGNDTELFTNVTCPSLCTCNINITDDSHINGIPCSARYWCPLGSTEEQICPGGFTCGPLTGDPTPCNAGYYCPTGSDSETKCVYPTYCPAQSATPLYCRGGWIAVAFTVDVENLRTSENDSCQLCQQGYFTNDSLNCYPCPAGYYCPEGTHNPYDNPCEPGFYCPEASDAPSSCPAGTYGPSELATMLEDCLNCANNTYNNLEAQSACKPCGSSAMSSDDAKGCLCNGKNRQFFPSDGTCICYSGYVFYDEADKRESEANSDLDCQPIVDERCGAGMVRLSSSRRCVDSEYACTEECKGFGGRLSIELGRCICSSYPSPVTLCNLTCQSTAPNVFIENIQGTTYLSIIESSTSFSYSSPLLGSFGLSFYNRLQHSTQVCEFDPLGQIKGKIFRSTDDIFTQFSGTLSGFARKRRQTDTNTTTTDVADIDNPLLCLEIDEAVVFTISAGDNGSYHYPVYVKDHLLNTNLGFDYGPFNQLANYIVTDVNISNFVYVFTEAGTYVFSDSILQENELIIRVMEEGTSCERDGNDYRVLPTSEQYLNEYGVTKSKSQNQEPNFAVIFGVTAATVFIVILLIIGLVIWKPKNMGISMPKTLKPKYRRVDAPPVIIQHIHEDDMDTLEKRGVGVGAPAVVATDTTTQPVEELENFNVRTFYDKLEDQTLHVTAQLAKQRQELKGFYERISQQTEDLKSMVGDMDVQAIVERNRSLQRESYQQQPSGDTPESRSDPLGQESQFPYTLGSLGNQQIEVVRMLEHLLQQVRKDQSPKKRRIMRRMKSMQRPRSASVGSTVKSNDPSRRWIIEREKLERQLAEEEVRAVKEMIEKQDVAFRNDVLKSSETLADKMVRMTSPEQIDQLVKNHINRLKALEELADEERRKQMNQLQEVLAVRRRKALGDLQQAQTEQAKSSNLPPPPPLDLDECTDHVSKTLHAHMQAFNNLLDDEQLAIAKTGAQEDNECTAETSRILNQATMRKADQLVSEGAASEDAVQDMMEEQQLAQRAIAMNAEERKRRQIQILRERAAQRKEARMKKLKQKHKQEKDNFLQQLDKQMAEGDMTLVTKSKKIMDIEERQEKEVEALAKQIDSSNAQQEQKINEALNQQQIEEIKESHKEAMKKLLSESKLDPSQQDAIMQEYTENMRKIEDQVKDQKQQKMDEVKANLVERKHKQLSELELHAVGVSTQSSVEVVVPEVVVASKTAEEAALLHQQKQAQEDLISRQKQEQEDLQNRLEQEAIDEEANHLRQLEKTKQQVVRDKQGRLQTEIDAVAVSEEERKEILRQHDAELKELERRIDMEKGHQVQALRDKFAEKRRRKLDAQQRKHEIEVRKEAIEQKKELAEVRTKQIKEAEKKAIITGLQDNNVDKADIVIRKVLEQRHNQELQDLIAQCETEKIAVLTEAMSKLQSEHDAEREKILSQHEQEMNNLLSQGADLTPSQLEERKLRLLNSQQQQLNKLDQQFAKKKQQIEEGQLVELEAKHARQKVEMREKHYQEVIDAFSEMAPKTASLQRSTDAVREAVKELETVKLKLEAERKRREEELDQQRKQFELEQANIMESELAEFNKELEMKSAQEEAEAERSLQILKERRMVLMEQRKEKMLNEISATTTETEREQLLRQYNEDAKRLESKAQADLIRQEADLKEKIRKKKEKMMKAKDKELQEHQSKRLQEQEEKELQERQKMAEQEKTRLQETVTAQDSILSPDGDYSNPMDEELQQMEDDNEEMDFMTMGAMPLTEEQLSSLLMSTPIYQKLEQIRGLLQSAPLAASTAAAPAPQKVITSEPGFAYIDNQDANWLYDTEFHPVDLNSIPVRAFVVYKFGVFIINLLCRNRKYPSVHLLLADKIPPNKSLVRNAYRNSFRFESHNRILYIRLCRLDNVGEFVVVLVHTLAHIKTDTLSDDMDPLFIKEFYRSLSICCSDFFFSRHNSESALAATSDEPLLNVLEEIFERVHTASEKSNALDDVIDTRILMDTTSDGDEFSHENIMARLDEYQDFMQLSKLKDYLGEVEENIAAPGHATADYVDRRLMELHEKNESLRKAGSMHRVASKWMSVLHKSPARPQSSLSRSLPRSMFLLRKRMSSAFDSDGKPDMYKQMLQTQIENLQEKVDELTAEYSAFSKDRIDLVNQLSNTEKELSNQMSQLNSLTSGSEEHTILSAKVKDTNARLSAYKTDLSTLDFKSNACSKRLDGFRSQLEQKQQSLQQH